MPAPTVHPPSSGIPTPAEWSEAAIRGFQMMAAAWGLTTAEQLILLGEPSRSAFFAWKKSPVALSGDTLERISYLLGIWKALHNLIPDEPQALAWMRKPNDHVLFGGKAPLEKLLQGRMLDLADVRRMLDARMGVW
ncbi:MAG TPA: MbcA/ParS/Xre antitoxin family protein [Holophaga sp.]|nr:MbcA/ParS/Xre antitoxin family protein [Holophaga sp.]